MQHAQQGDTEQPPSDLARHAQALEVLLYEARSRELTLDERTALLALAESLRSVLSGGNPRHFREFGYWGFTT